MILWNLIFVSTFTSIWCSMNVCCIDFYVSKNPYRGVCLNNIVWSYIFWNLNKFHILQLVWPHVFLTDVLLYIFKDLMKKNFLIIIYKGNFVHMDARSQTTNQHLLGKFLWERPGHKLSSSFSLPCLFSPYVKLKTTSSQIQIFSLSEDFPIGANEINHLLFHWI